MGMPSIFGNHPDGVISNGKIVGEPFIKMDGQAVFKFAVKVLSEVVEEVLMADFKVKRAQLDALWSYVGNKGEKKLSRDR